MKNCGDWVMFLPFALYQVRNSPNWKRLTHFEITYGGPSPITPILQSTATGELEDDEFITKVRATHWVHEQAWPKLCAFYEAGPVPEPYKCQPGDWVYMKRFCWDMLEPRWKGPFTSLLIMPTGIKVDRIAAGPTTLT